ncbi:MAG: ABC transporter permease, partial [Chloroflexia bacterium]|nr:ABC transporter permease [Chloroflexia bacterium]
MTGGDDFPLVAFVTAMLAAGLVAAVPLVLAALGEAVGERAGLLNLGIEGMMLCGAFFGFLIAFQTGSAVAGVVAGIAAGAILGLVFATLTISLRVDQVLVGLAITIFGGGVTAFLYRDSFGGQNPSL